MDFTNKTNIMMNKKNYEKPTMTIVELRHRTQLLTGSSVQASRNSYGTANQGVSETELNKDGGWWEWN